MTNKVLLSLYLDDRGIADLLDQLKQHEGMDINSMVLSLVEVPITLNKKDTRIGIKCAVHRVATNSASASKASMYESGYILTEILLHE
jgi:hypothetical protein